jgi:hypothetical protein
VRHGFDFEETSQRQQNLVSVYAPLGISAPACLGSKMNHLPYVALLKSLLISFRAMFSLAQIKSDTAKTKIINMMPMTSEYSNIQVQISLHLV